MLTEAAARAAIHSGKLQREAQVLLCLAVGDQPKTVGAVRQMAVALGVPKARKINVSQVLTVAKAKAARTPKGWELLPGGRALVATLTGSVAAVPATQLRTHLAAIASKDTRAFVEEAIACLELKQYRAATVLSWVGAVAVLYDHVVAHHLTAFNAEATRRDSKWKKAKTVDDLALLGEFDFLQVLHSLSVIGKNAKHELETCLKLRNGCGHPNTLVVKEHRVASHIETLADNVFAKF